MTSAVASRIARQYANTIFFTLLRVAATLLLGYVVGHSLTPAANGDYSNVSVIVQVGLYLLGLDLYVYVMRFVPGTDKEYSLSTFKTVLAVEVLLTVVVMTVLVLSGMDYRLARILDSENPWAYRLGLVLLAEGLMSMELLRYFRARQRIEIANQINFLRTHGWVFGLGVIWWVTKSVSLKLLLVFWTVGMLLAVGYGITRIGWGTFAQARINLKLVRPALAFSLPIFAATMGTMLTGNADRFMLSYFRSLAENGMYSYAYYFINFGLLFTGSMTEDILVPYVTACHNQGRLERRNFFLSRLLKYSLMSVIPFVTLFWVLRREVLGVLAQPEYMAAATVVPFMLLAPVARTVAIPFRYLLLLNERVWWIAVVSLLGAGVNLAFNLWWIPAYGMMGAALAGGVAYSGVTVCLYWLTRQTRAICLRDSKVVNLVLAGSLGLALVLGLYQVLSLEQSQVPDIVLLIGISGGYIALYSMLLTVFRVVEGDEWLYVWEGAEHLWTSLVGAIRIVL